MGKQRNGQIDRQTNRKGHSDRWTNRKVDKYTDIQTDNGQKDG